MMAEFDTPNDVISRRRRTYAAGYRKIDAYVPFPIEELAEAIGFHKNGVALVCLIGGSAAALTGYLCSGGFQQRQLSHQYWRPAADIRGHRLLS